MDERKEMIEIQQQQQQDEEEFQIQRLQQQQQEEEEQQVSYQQQQEEEEEQRQQQEEEEQQQQQQKKKNGEPTVFFEKQQQQEQTGQEVVRRKKKRRHHPLPKQQQQQQQQNEYQLRKLRKRQKKARIIRMPKKQQQQKPQLRQSSRIRSSSKKTVRFTNDDPSCVVGDHYHLATTASSGTTAKKRKRITPTTMNLVNSPDSIPLVPTFTTTSSSPQLKNKKPNNTVSRRMGRKKFRVLVIGCGISGLAAARELQERGYEVLIVEARNRPGGRLKGGTIVVSDVPNRNNHHNTTTTNNNREEHESTTSSSNLPTAIPIDLGGALIHGIINNPVYDLVQQMDGCSSDNDNDNPSSSSSSSLLQVVRGNDCMLLDDTGWPIQPSVDERIYKKFNDCLDETFRRIHNNATTTTTAAAANNNKNKNAKDTEATEATTTTATTTTTTTTQDVPLLEVGSSIGNVSVETETINIVPPPIITEIISSIGTKKTTAAATATTTTAKTNKTTVVEEKKKKKTKEKDDNDNNDGDDVITTTSRNGKNRDTATTTDAYGADGKFAGTRMTNNNNETNKSQKEQHQQQQQLQQQQQEQQQNLVEVKSSSAAIATAESAAASTPTRASRVTRSSSKPVVTIPSNVNTGNSRSTAASLKKRVEETTATTTPRKSEDNNSTSSSTIILSPETSSFGQLFDQVCSEQKIIRSMNNVKNTTTTTAPVSSNTNNTNTNTKPNKPTSSIVSTIDPIFQWHKSNLELSAGETFDQLGWLWNEDEMYGYDGDHVAIRDSWNVVINRMISNVDIVYNSPVSKIQIMYHRNTNNTNKNKNENENSNNNKKNNSGSSIMYKKEKQTSNNNSKDCRKMILIPGGAAARSNNKDILAGPKPSIRRSRRILGESETVRRSNRANKGTGVETYTIDHSSMMEERLLQQSNTNKKKRKRILLSDEMKSFVPSLNNAIADTATTTANSSSSSNNNKRFVRMKGITKSRNKRRSVVHVTLAGSGKVLEADAVVCTLPLGILKRSIVPMNTNNPIQTDNTEQFIRKDDKTNSSNNGVKRKRIHPKTSAASSPAKNNGIHESTAATITTTNNNKTNTIINIPTGRKANDDSVVVFDPPLPIDKQTAIAQLGTGLLNKCVMSFPYRFWQADSDFLGLAAPARPYLILNGSKYTGGYPILIFLFGGATARYVDELWTDQDVLYDCLVALKRICGSRTIPDPIDYHVTRWGQEPYSRMAFSYVPIGVNGFQALQTLSQPIYDIDDESDGDVTNVDNRKYSGLSINDKTNGEIEENDMEKGKQQMASTSAAKKQKIPILMFAGEHTTPYHPSTIHGAFLSGIREAYRLDCALDPAGNDFLEFSEEQLYERTFRVNSGRSFDHVLMDNNHVSQLHSNTAGILVEANGSTTTSATQADAFGDEIIHMQKDQQQSVQLHHRGRRGNAFSATAGGTMQLTNSSASSTVADTPSSDVAAVTLPLDQSRVAAVSNPTRRSKRAGHSKPGISLSSTAAIYASTFASKKAAPVVSTPKDSTQRAQDLRSLEDRILSRGIESYGYNNLQYIRETSLPIHGTNHCDEGNNMDAAKKQNKSPLSNRDNFQNRCHQLRRSLPKMKSSNAWKSWVIDPTTTSQRNTSLASNIASMGTKNTEDFVKKKLTRQSTPTRPTIQKNKKQQKNTKSYSSVTNERASEAGETTRFGRTSKLPKHLNIG